MTAEIAVLNKSGIALAADSAVSIVTTRNTKIYNTNKLFMLSKYHPVGAMIYGSAEFMGIPWETIIKHYRKQLGDTSFKTLKECGSHFMAFLNNNSYLFPPNSQNEHVYSTTYSIFSSIEANIDAKVEEATHKGLTLAAADIEGIAEKEIKETLDAVNARPRLPTSPPKFEIDILSRYYKIIEQAIDDIFKKYSLSTVSRKRLRRISITLFINDFFDVQDDSGNELIPSSGVVIAGFGDDDLYPALVSYEMEGVAGDLVKYKTEIEVRITSSNTAALIPFAQKEMVYSFMNGVSPNYNKALLVYLSEIFEKYPEELVKRFKGLTAKQKKDLTEELKKDGSSLLSVFADNIMKWAKKYNSDKILQSIEVLPIAELATMAESLVNLTSFKRRVTLEVAETVGGPIDVAVISKGDGFIWIRRKHYFEGTENPHFLNNYYR